MTRRSQAALAARARPSTRPRAALSVAAMVALHGCGGPQGPSTPQGLREENRALRERADDLRERAESRRAERLDAEASLKKEYQERLAAAERLHRGREAILEGAIAALRMDLATTSRERLALRQLVDSRPRAEAARRRLSDVVAAALGVLLIATLTLLVLAAARWSSPRDHLRAIAAREPPAPRPGEATP